MQVLLYLETPTWTACAGTRLSVSAAHEEGPLAEIHDLHVLRQQLRAPSLCLAPHSHFVTIRQSQTTYLPAR